MRIPQLLIFDANETLRDQDRLKNVIQKNKQ
jgi:hypothetical protein